MARSRRPPEIAVGVLLGILVFQFCHTTFISPRFQPAGPASRQLTSPASPARPCVPERSRATVLPTLALTLLALAPSVAKSPRRRLAGSSARRSQARSRCVLQAAAGVQDWQTSPDLPQEPMLISLDDMDALASPGTTLAPADCEPLPSAQSSEQAYTRSGRRRPQDRQQRRRCGARLLEHSSVPPVPCLNSTTAALDMSRVRTKIQLGIRCSSMHPRCKGREAKTGPECSSPLGSSDGQKVRVELCSSTRRSKDN
eukprot:g19907.t1